MPPAQPCDMGFADGHVERVDPRNVVFPADGSQLSYEDLLYDGY